MFSQGNFFSWSFSQTQTWSCWTTRAGPASPTQGTPAWRSWSISCSTTDVRTWRWAAHFRDERTASHGKTIFMRIKSLRRYFRSTLLVDRNKNNFDEKFETSKTILNQKKSNERNNVKAQSKCLFLLTKVKKNIPIIFLSWKYHFV